MKKMLQNVHPFFCIYSFFNIYFDFQKKYNNANLWQDMLHMMNPVA